MSTIMIQHALFENPSDRPERIGLTLIQDRPKAKALTKPSGALAGYDYALNAFVGCAFGCSYCYAASFVADEQKQRDWGLWVDIKNSALDEIKRATLHRKKIFMSSATDPYQPIEAHVQLTRSLLEVMVHPLRQPKLVIQTRSPLVTRDIDLLKQFESVQVNMSITTDDDEMRKRFEPSCPSIERRLEAVAKLESAGIRTQVCLSPLLPVKNATEFAHRILATGTRKVVVGSFHQTDRRFASTTRVEGLVLARQQNWDHRAYRLAVSLLRNEIPQLTEHWELPN